MTNLLAPNSSRGASRQLRLSKGGDWWSRRFWVPVLIGVFSALALVPVIIGLAGGGHGTLWPLPVLFPYAVIAAAITDLPDSHMLATAVGLTVTVVQLPVYGALIGATCIGRSKWFLVWLALFVHIMLAGAILIHGDFV